MRGDVAEEAQGISFVTAFLVRTGKRQGTLGKSVRLLQTAGQHLRLSQGETTEHLKSTLPVTVLRSIACVSSGTASAPRPPRVYASPKAAAIEGKLPGSPCPTDAHSVFEQESALRRSPWRRASRPSPHKANIRLLRVMNRLGNPQPFFPKGTALNERAEFGMAYGEAGTGEDGGQEHLAKALAVPRPGEERHGLPKAVDRLTIVALGLVGEAKGLVRQRVQNEIPASRGERQGTLSSGDGLVICTTGAELV